MTRQDVKLLATILFVNLVFWGGGGYGLYSCEMAMKEKNVAENKRQQQVVEDLERDGCTLTEAGSFRGVQNLIIVRCKAAGTTTQNFMQGGKNSRQSTIVRIER